MNNLGDLWHLEPGLVVGCVTAFLVLLTAFGVPITADQKVAILGFIGAIWAIVSALVVRKKSMPLKTITDAGLNPQAVKAAAAEATAAKDGS